MADGGGEQTEFVVALGVADRQLHGEAVELRLGQRVGAVMLDRVLRGDHEKRRGQRMPDVVDRRLALGHRLQEGALRAGRGAVDLVGQEHVGEDRAGQELELARLLVEDAEAGDVAGQQVRRTLHARELPPTAAASRLGQRRLTQARQILEEQMAPRQQAGQHLLDHVRLAAQRPVQRRA